MLLRGSGHRDKMVKPKTIEILSLFWYSINATIKLFRKVVLSIEIADLIFYHTECGRGWSLLHFSNPLAGWARSLADDDIVSRCIQSA